MNLFNRLVSHTFVFTHYLCLSHYLMCIVGISCVFFLHDCGVPSLKPSFFVVFISLPPPPLSPAHQQAASQSKAQKKFQPFTQVPVLQEQGEYCIWAGGSRTWVPAVWWGGGGCRFCLLFYFFAFPFMLSFCLNFHLSTHLHWCFVTPTLSPSSHKLRETPNMQKIKPPSGWRCGGPSLVWLHRSLGSRAPSSCVCTLSAASTHGPSNAPMPLLSNLWGGGR